jgi:hypothetical protein
MRSEACGCPKVRFADLQTPAGGPRDLVLRVTMTRASNEVGARSRRECRTTASTGPGRKIATVERREAGVSLRWKRWASKARRPHAGRGMHYRVLAAPGRLSALRHPLIGVANRKSEIANSEKREERAEERERERETRRERFFVGWAKAHAEQRMSSPRALSLHGSQGDTERWTAPLPTLQGCLTS